MSSSTSNQALPRRNFLRLLAVGAGLTLAAFALPLHLVARLARPTGRQRMPPLPGKPFEPAGLRDPHDLAG